MKGYIYKITNTQNDKIYVGQTIRTIAQRFRRHINDANNGLDTHFARAIRQYGETSFNVSLLEEVDGTSEYITEREYFWINKLDAYNSGYNEALSTTRCGGNTYHSKTKDEMDIIKNKIRATKLLDKNPHSVRVKCIDIESNDIKTFNSIKEAQIYFNEPNHSFVSKRCRKVIKKPYKDKFTFEYIK